MHDRAFNEVKRMQAVVDNPEQDGNIIIGSRAEKMSSQIVGLYKGSIYTVNILA